MGIKTKILDAVPFSGTTHMLFDRAKKRTAMDFNGFPTPRHTTIFVWEPYDGIGHVSMAIGDQTRFTMEKWYHQTVGYASWFPGASTIDPDVSGADGMGVLPGRKYLKRSHTFMEDCKSEGCGGESDAPGKPEHIIQLLGLSVPAMMAEWSEICDKPDAHYRLLRKNCSTIVARILRAGTKGLTVWNQATVQLWAHQVYWTPQDCLKFAKVLKNMQ